VQREEETTSAGYRCSNTEEAVARRVAEAKRRGAQLIELDAIAQRQREHRLSHGVGWDEATRLAAMATRIRADGGVTDHVAMGLSQRHGDVITVRAAAVGCIAMVPADDEERGPSAEEHCRRGGSRWGAQNPLPSASDLGSFGVPFRTPGPPVICRMGCGRAGWNQADRRADICCAECYGGNGHSRMCDIRNGVYPDPEPDPDPPDLEPEPDYDTDPDYDMEPGCGTDSGSAVDVDVVEVGGGRGAGIEARTRGRVLVRGDYVTFTEYFHGEGAIGVMSVMDNAAAPGLTFIGEFDVMQDAHDLVTERHGFPPHLCDAAAFYADPSALYVADVVGGRGRSASR